MNVSAVVLAGFIAWTLALVVLMVVLRVRLVVNRSVRANQFTPSNEGLPPFMQRLARAHANCVENLPILGGLLIVALLTQLHIPANVTADSGHRDRWRCCAA